MAGFDVSGSGGGAAAAASTPTIQALGALGATETIDMASETWVWATGTLDANCAVTLSNLASGDRVTLFLAQDATGGRTLSVNGSSLAIPTAALAEIKVECEYDGTDLFVDVAGGGGIQETVVNAKGDILAATAADAVTRLAVGANDTVLTADSAQATGLKWAAAAGGVTVVRKTADETVNNSDVLQNDDHLVLPVLANETWSFELWLLLSAANTTADWKFAFTVPASTTMLWGAHSGTATQNQWETLNTAGAPVALNTEATTLTAGSAAVTHGHLFRGVIRVAGTAGNVQFQWAQNTANATDSKVLEDSLLVARRIATS